MLPISPTFAFSSSSAPLNAHSVESQGLASLTICLRSLRLCGPQHCSTLSGRETALHMSLSFHERLECRSGEQRPCLP